MQNRNRTVNFGSDFRFSPHPYQLGPDARACKYYTTEMMVATIRTSYELSRLSLYHK
ncbi:hypothetical protein Hanom_Chr04g00294191 [Helianthus anomalus]